MRVLAYLRPSTPGLHEILEVLACEREVAAICAVPGLASESQRLPERAGFQLFSRPVSFSSLLSQASLFISYGPAASVTQALLKGVPQLIAPAHVEAQMTAVRVLAMGAGLVLRKDLSKEGVRDSLTRVLRVPGFKIRALDFAQRYQEFNPAHAVDRVVTDIEALAAGQYRQSAAAG
jgi:UDP:flavonoid glycosyltransferase YjiC (YdhE family)